MGLLIVRVRKTYTPLDADENGVISNYTLDIHIEVNTMKVIHIVEKKA